MNEMDRMQADAANRARDMYRRSQNYQGYNVNSLPNGYNGSMRESKKLRPNDKNDNQESVNETVSETTEEIAENPVSDSLSEKNPPQNENNVPLTGLGGDFLDQLLGDKERTLIILLIALLNEERANTSLLLALMYLIM